MRKKKKETLGELFEREVGRPFDPEALKYEGEGATLEQLYMAVHFPESIKFKDKDEQRYWDRLTAQEKE